MTRYTALIDGEAGGYGVTFPDLPGCTAMGDTLDSALHNAADSLRDYVVDAREHGVRNDPEMREALAEGASFATVALVLSTGRPVKANLSLDEGILAAIDAEALRRCLTRSALIELMAREMLVDVA